MKRNTPRTMDGFLKQLEADNKTVAGWARENDFDLEDVYAITRGRNKGRRGKAREILLAMGITPPAMFNSAAVRKAA